MCLCVYVKFIPEILLFHCTAYVLVLLLYETAMSVPSVCILSGAMLG